MRVFLFFFFFGMLISQAQEGAWFYIRAKDSLFAPTFKEVGERMVYTGSDAKLKAILNKNPVKTFKKTYKKAKRKDLKKTFFVIADQESLLNELLTKASHVFASGEIIPEADKKIYEPNDYGLTSTIGENIGLQVNLDYLDALGLPQAWYYTTGSPDVNVGISDGAIAIDNKDFKDKTTVFNKSSLSKGHGYTISGAAAAQGDNGYGVPGVCFDCGIYSTRYGDFRNFAEVKELSDAGAKVVNCSWVGLKYYESGQTAINKLFENGTVVVAAAGNKDFTKTHGNTYYYPASYKHVISVSSGMYKHETPLDAIDQLSNGSYYASNVRGYIGRTMGFKNNDTLQEPHTYDISIPILNTDVDILAPTTGLFMYSDYIMKGKIVNHQFEATSGAAPFVTGTIGLMFSLYPCLPVDEVESILKITATNIDHIAANKPYAGLYGAGMLHTGRAVKLVHDLHSPSEIAYIENQDFSRWDFKITATSKEVVIRNQKFREDATLELASKNSIVIGENTALKPKRDGKIYLKIDPSIKNECDLVLRQR